MKLQEPLDSPPELVTFERPPVTEVGLAIQFEKAVIDLAVLAEFTGRVSSDFPNREQHPPLPPMSEDFSVPPRMQALALEIGPPFVLPRSWFVTEDGSHVLQLQEDRFVFNWRRPTPDHAEYPRYRLLREQFRQRLVDLVESITATKKHVPPTNFCEVLYANQIDAEGSGDRSHRELGEILVPVKARPEFEFLRASEDSQYQARFRIITNSGDPRGRLYLSAVPAFRPDESPIYTVNLTSRLIPQNDSQDEPWESLNLGREWIVKGFVDLTTEEMHQEWGLKPKENSGA